MLKVIFYIIIIQLTSFYQKSYIFSEKSLTDNYSFDMD